MPTYVYRNGQMIDKATGEPMLSEAEKARPLQTPKTFGDTPGYHSPVTGEWIEGKRARKYDMEKHGCVDGAEFGPRKNTMKNEKFARKHGLTHLLS